MWATAFAAEPPLKPLLKAVEQRYNRTVTLEVLFSQRYTMQGRTRTESGQLWLRKPGRMRWEYSRPAGKLFISDGKFIYFYSPTSNRAEKNKLKESEDLRAPLAFLLGKLDFDREFGAFTATTQGADTLITATAKSNRLPYTDVEFLVSPAHSIRRLLVRGQDRSVLEYSFDGEKVNPPIDDAMFRFKLPPGAEFVEALDEEDRRP
jgi:outer membrane lipoprotein carrier protein